MSRLEFLTLGVLLVLSGAASAQEGEKPLFADPVPKPETGTAPNTTDAPSRTTSDGVERMSAWPETAGVEAARSFVAMGRKAVPVLLENLGNRDWRIRCGCAWALGELREREALPVLRDALRDVANRIAMRPFFDALVKIDPTAAVGDILPFLGSKFPRTAVAAYEALPEVIDQSFEKDLRALLRTAPSEVRFRVLDLVTRLEKPVEPAVYVELLGDPVARIAKRAADVLARSEDDVRPLLLAVVLEGTMRRASYALLALVAIEDRTNRVALAESPELKRRIFQLMRVPGELENAAGAVALANISMRSSDEKVREVTDEHAVLYLLHAAGGGRLFKDYLSVRDLCFRKAAMLTGESFGEDGDRWIAWWKENHEGFRARRELRGIDPADHDELAVTLAFRPESGRELRVVLRGGDPVSTRRGSVRPVWMDSADIDDLTRALETFRFFDGRGSARDPDWAGAYVEATVTVGRAAFTRAEYGDISAAALQFVADVRAIVDRNVWQSFRNAATEPDPAAWIASNRGRLSALDGDARDRVLGEMGLEAFHEIDRRGRSAAVDTWGRLGGDWLKAREDRLVRLLEPRGAWSRPTVDLLGLIGRVPGPEVTAKVLDALPLYTEEGRDLALAYLAPRPLDDVLAIPSSSPDVTSVVVRDLARRGDDTADRRAVDMAGDADSRVRAAFIEAFDGDAGERVLSLVFERADRLEGVERRAMIELAGAVGGEAAVGRLAALYNNSDMPTQRAVIRALGAAESAGAVERLLAIGRDDEIPVHRGEALAVLGELDPELVRESYRRAMQEEQRAERLEDLLAAGVAVFSGELATELGPFLEHADPGVRRAAALVLAPEGVGATVPVLLELLLDRPMSAKARELLELVTGFTVDEPTVEGARLAYEAWWVDNRDNERLDWIMAAFEAAEYPAAALGAFRRGNLQDPAALTVLLRAVRSDVWHVRQNAHLMLSKARGSSVGSLGRDASPADIERNANRWDTWFRTIREKL